MSASIQAQVYIPKFDVQGHRGARGLMPENTIPAFIAALDQGVTTLELDVIISKDKKVVVSHEPWMSAEICLQPDGSEILKKEEKRFNIYQLYYDEISRFDCGTKPVVRFPEQKKIKISKPLLSDVIVAVENHIKNSSQYEVDYNIEIKSTQQEENIFQPSVQDFSDIVYQLINQYLPLERVVIQSFDFRVLQYWNRTYPQVRLAALVENTKSVDSNLQALGFTPSIYSPYYKLLSKEQIQYLKNLKVRVIPWTVNEAGDMKRLKSWGVDGLITDYPNRANELGFTIQRSK
jgi:glycerophosphoryl diester phosphodiesterase